MTVPDTPGAATPDSKGGSILGSLKSFRLWLGLALSAGSIWFLLQNIKPEQVGQALQSANYLLIVPSIGMVFATMFFKAVRWQLLLMPSRLPLGRLFSSLLIGYMANAILPARLGEVVRAYHIGRSGNTTTSHALSTIVVEKVLDIGTVLIILVCLIPFAPLPEWAFKMGIVGAAVVLVLIALIAALIVFGKQITTLIINIASRLPVLHRLPLEGQIDSFLRGFEVLRSRSLAPPILFWSVVVWIGAAAINYLMLIAFVPNAPITSALFVLAVTNLGMAVPSAPSYIGVYHYLVVISLVVFGIDQNLALSYAIVLHACTFGSFVVSGLLLMWRDNFSLSSAKRGAVGSELR